MYEKFMGIWDVFEYLVELSLKSKRLFPKNDKMSRMNRDSWWQGQRSSDIQWSFLYEHWGPVQVASKIQCKHTYKSRSQVTSIIPRVFTFFLHDMSLYCMYPLLRHLTIVLCLKHVVANNSFLHANTWPIRQPIIPKASCLQWKSHKLSSYTIWLALLKEKTFTTWSPLMEKWGAWPSCTKRPIIVAWTVWEWYTANANI